MWSKDLISNLFLDKQKILAENLQHCLLSLSITDSFLNTLVIYSSIMGENPGSWDADAVEKKECYVAVRCL